MYKLFITSLTLLLYGFSPVLAQAVVFDPQHFLIVNENGAVRLAAENTHNNYLGNINNRLDRINQDMGMVVYAQSLIYSALTQVNAALRSGMAAQQIAGVSSEIVGECNTMLDIARADPILLLFAEDVARQMKDRGIKLVTEVSDFVLKEGSNVLMDYEKRDALLRKILLELRVMRALTYSVSRSMYWAKLRGILRSAGPYQSFINQDTRIATDLMRNIKILKP
ncbi:hypothetical protein [Mucilaginibacter pineti]|nr:hypothetical protein [Mucilaginibacter pineti]